MANTDDIDVFDRLADRASRRVQAKKVLERSRLPAAPLLKPSQHNPLTSGGGDVDSEPESVLSSRGPASSSVRSPTSQDGGSVDLVARCLNDVIVAPRLPKPNRSAGDDGAVTVAQNRLMIEYTLSQLDRHEAAFDTAVADVRSRMEEIAFEREAIRKRIAIRAARRDRRLPFPYNPNTMRWVPTPNEIAMSLDELVKAESAARVRLFARPTIAPPNSTLTSLCGRRRDDFCYGATQHFHNRFEFTVQVTKADFKANVLRVMHGNAAAVARFNADVTTALEMAAVGFRVSQIYKLVKDVVMASTPGFAMRLYLSLIPERTRNSDLVKSSPVPPPLTAAQLLLTAQQLSLGVESPLFDKATNSRMADFVNHYRVTYHAAVEQMVAVTCGEAAAAGKPTPVGQWTPCGVPLALARAPTEAAHFPPWVKVVTDDTQPIDIDLVAMPPPPDGGIMWELADRPAMSTRPSYFECFAHLWLHCDPFFRDALDLMFS